MSKKIQKFLLENTKPLQKLVNEKLANGPVFPKFFKWMEIGKRQNSSHSLEKYFKVFNSLTMQIAYRFNYGRPHLQKQLFSREREFMLIGYAAMLTLIFVYTKKNKLRLLYSVNDPYLNEIDNSNYLSKLYGVIVPTHVTKYKVSAHYLEINKIFSSEMMKKFIEYENEVKEEFDSSSEKVKRTKYISNPNYVYKPFGWENQKDE